MNHSFAIVCTPCKNMVHGHTTANLGEPNYQTALNQHKNYINLLKELELEVNELLPDENYPDSTFVEDTAVFTPEFSVLTNPGAESRKGEIKAIEKNLEEKFSDLKKIKNPDTLDGGDVLEVEDHFYIGISERTNQAGADQFIEIVKKYGMTGSTIPVKKGLHLKSAVSYLGNNYMLIDSEALNINYFEGFTKITTASGEGYAANSISVNGSVILPEGFPKTKEKVELAGFSVRTLNVSEFRKLDGGLSCLSLRY